MFENVVCEMLFISSRSQCVKAFHIRFMTLPCHLQYVGLCVLNWPIQVESMKTTSTETISIGVPDKNKEHNIRSIDKAEKII